MIDRHVQVNFITANFFKNCVKNRSLKCHRLPTPLSHGQRQTTPESLAIQYGWRPSSSSGGLSNSTCNWRWPTAWKIQPYLVTLNGTWLKLGTSATVHRTTDVGGQLSVLGNKEPAGVISHKVRNKWPEQCQTYGYLPSFEYHRPSTSTKLYCVVT